LCIQVILDMTVVSPSHSLSHFDPAVPTVQSFLGLHQQSTSGKLIQLVATGLPKTCGSGGETVAMVKTARTNSTAVRTVMWAMLAVVTVFSSLQHCCLGTMLLVPLGALGTSTCGHKHRATAR
jgi:hypothetical protein